MLRPVKCILGVIVVLLVAPPAGAMSLTSETGDPLPTLQAWANASHAPLPPGPVVVRRARCPSDAATSCIYWASPEIWLSDEDFARRSVFSHELGHRFDYLVMTAKSRAAFKALVRDRRPWRSAPNSPHEKFAEAYGLCFRHKTINGPLEWAYEYNPSSAAHKSACRIIRRAAAGAYG